MTKELIDRFFKGQCTPAEAVEVSKYLNDHPDVLENYAGYQEWQHTAPQEMPAEFWNENWAAISTGMATRPGKIVWLKRTAAAAMLIVATGLAYKAWLAPTRKQAVVEVVTTPAPPERKITVNNSAQVMDLVLPDSTDVKLSPGSLISYHLPFTGGRREITLDGEGRFNVVKSERQPFTVYAGGLATTALGTEFTINTRNNVSVKLHNGKVMITATGEMLRSWTKNVILKPGQQLEVNSRNMLVSVGAIRTETAAVQKKVMLKPKKHIPAVTPGLDFMNTSLPEVMEKLSGYYHQQISFDSTGLSKMNFTGTISRNDSLNIVLKVIAQMNDLQLTHDDSGYELKRTEKSF